MEPASPRVDRGLRRQLRQRLTVPKAGFAGRRGPLGPAELLALDNALRGALALDWSVACGQAAHCLGWSAPLHGVEGVDKAEAVDFGRLVVGFGAGVEQVASA